MPKRKRNQILKSNTYYYHTRMYMEEEMKEVNVKQEEELVGLEVQNRNTWRNSISRSLRYTRRVHEGGGC